MENDPLRGFFGVSSPRPKEQRVAPQPTENIYIEIPSGMIEKLLANPLRVMELQTIEIGISLEVLSYASCSS